MEHDQTDGAPMEDDLKAGAKGKTALLCSGGEKTGNLKKHLALGNATAGWRGVQADRWSVGLEVSAGDLGGCQ